jgi:hypothetical protein
MDKRLNKKLEGWITEFKDDIINEICKLEFQNNDQTNKLRQFVYDHSRLLFTKEDFQKRKRIKNVVPFFERCCAKRANNEHCTRRKKDKGEFCGTHMKGTPHGIIDNQNESKPNTQKIEVWAQDIKGIIYYIDKMYNVYQAEDVVVNKPNPKIIAKYVKNGDIYNIPEFNI